jgi:GNAT superfamily N-acetyltransferase
MSVSVTHRDRDTQPVPPEEVTVEAVLSRRGIREFVNLPYAMYEGSEHWIPPLRRDERNRLSRDHNPFFAHADVRLWLARRGGRLTGRIASIDDRLHNETHRERVTWFGFFEASDESTARALLDTVERGARSHGSASVRGPANPSLNDSVGLLVDGFEHDPYILMPYNPPAYASYLEHAGYVKAKDLLAWDLDLSVPLGERIQRVGQRLMARRRIRVRTVDMSSNGFAADLEHLKTIYRSAWSDNWGFVPPTDAEIRQLATELKPVVDPNLVLFAEHEGRVVGCAVALPDLNQVLKRMGGRLLPGGLWHYLRRRSIITQARALLLGVLPGYRRRGLYPLLVYELHRRGCAAGYTRGELSWTLEDNELVNAGIEAAGGRRHKTYRLYEKPVR